MFFYDVDKLNPRYTEAEKLDRLLTEASIPHTKERLLDGWQISYQVSRQTGGDMCICDAVQNFGSYGGKENLLEIMGLVDETRGDEVEGYLTADEVFDRIKEDYDRRRNHE